MSHTQNFMTKKPLTREQMLEKLTILAHLQTVMNLGFDIIGALDEYLDRGEDGTDTPEEDYLTGDFNIQAMRIRPKYNKYFEILNTSKTIEETIDRALELEAKNG